MIQQWLIASYKPAASWPFNWPFTTADFTTQAGSPTWTGTQVTFPWGTTCKIKNTNTYASQIVYIQSDFTWATSAANEDLAGIILTNQSTLASSAYSTTYAAKITSRNSAWWQYRLFGWAATYNTYGLEPSINKWTAVKITFDTSSNALKYWHWNWSAWAQMWTTQTINILNGWTLYFHLFYDQILDNLGTTTFDKLYFGSTATDYTTQYPV